MTQGVKLSSLLETIDSSLGRERVAAFLEKQPFPHFRPVPGKRGLLEKIDANGTRTVGRFVQRVFTPTLTR